MVNFTCNTCGDSLKKKDVVTHFGRKYNCREAASLTCIDCLKVFGKDYTGHTFCVSEDQRYSANGLGGIQKTKQEIRNELICKHLQSVLVNKGSTLSHGVKSVIEHLLQVAVVPRKEKAYLNFIKNSRKFLEKDALTVWSFVNEVKEPVPDQPKEAKQQEDNSTSNGVGDSPTADAGSPQKKKNKSQPSESTASLENSTEADGIVSEKKKKKKKKSKSDKSTAEACDEAADETLNTSEAAPDTVIDQEGLQEKVADAPVDEGEAMDVDQQKDGKVKVESKKEKKLKKKREKYEAEMKAVETAADQNEGEETVEDKEVPQQEGKKKKSKKLQAVQDENTDKTAVKGKKKRQRTESMIAEVDQPKKKNKGKENYENAEPEEEEQVEVSSERKDFKWADVIVKVLQDQNDKEMSIKRLCKKVVNEYLSSLLEGAHVDEVKVTAKFQKKLHKTPGVFVHKDKAKLKCVDES